MGQYNKDNPYKFCINFFVLSDSTNYLIRHIDVYQVNNTGEIYIHTKDANKTTKIESVINIIIVAGVGNYPYGSR